MSFDKCIYLCNQCHSHDRAHFCSPKKFPLPDSLQSVQPQPQANTDLFFCQCRLVSGLLEFHIYVLFRAWLLLLNIMFLRIILCPSLKTKQNKLVLVVSLK